MLWIRVDSGGGGVPSISSVSLMMSLVRAYKNAECVGKVGSVSDAPGLAENT